MANSTDLSNAADNDFYAWIMMNGDLLPPPLDSNNSLDIDPLSLDAPESLFDGLSNMDLDSAASQVNEPHQPPFKEPPELKKPTRSRSMISRATSAANSVSLSVNGTDTDTKDLSEEAKKQRRLLRNREIARNCRKRKKEKQLAFQQELKRVKARNKELEVTVTQLKAQLMEQGTNVKIKKEADDGQYPRKKSRRVDIRQLGFENVQILLSRVQKLKDEANKEPDSEKRKYYLEKLKRQERELKEELHDCKEIHSDFGNERESTINFHLGQLKNLISPTQLSKMTIWSLQQEDEFYDERKNASIFGGGIWNTICKELEFTPEQKSALINMRHQIRQQKSNIEGCLSILEELESRIKVNFKTLKMQMEKIMTITTPKQQASFILWIKKNQPAMHMLNNIWDVPAFRTSASQASKESGASSVTASSTAPKQEESKMDSEFNVSREDMERAFLSKQI